MTEQPEFGVPELADLGADEDDQQLLLAQVRPLQPDVAYWQGETLPYDGHNVNQDGSTDFTSDAREALFYGDPEQQACLRGSGYTEQLIDTAERLAEELEDSVNETTRGTVLEWGDSLLDDIDPDSCPDTDTSAF
ncbi:MAG: hypothetical protein KME03_15245 [Aphanocapsa lilacina HA4352-LM1]|jgi:hypothetical protein|nr:hypothetical protein [Aphanocapsa lilacina HA4352-LM1]